MKTQLLFRLFILVLSLFCNANFAQCWTKMETGRDHSLAIATDGTLWAWGRNNTGQCGNELLGNILTPTQIGTDSNWSKIAAGQGHSIALKTDGTLWTWGNNFYGQLGNGNNDPQAIPIQIATGFIWNQIAAGANHSLAVSNVGNMYSWGNNQSGQLGNGTYVSRNTPTTTPIGSGLSYYNISAFGNYSTAKHNLNIFAWGKNEYGQLGNGTISELIVPTQIGTDLDFGNIVAGLYHTMAIKTNGTMWSWGRNDDGQLGDGTVTNVTIPTQISDTDWFQVDAGYYHTVSVKTDATIWTWGSNNFGQLGDGTLTQRNNPTQIGTFVNMVDSKAGFDFSIFRNSSGVIYSCGRNDYGQLGDGTTTNRNVPVAIACPSALGLINQKDLVAKVELYPNPTSNGNFSIQSEKSLQMVIAFDILGKQIDVEKNNDSYKINASNGIYTIKITDSDGNSQIKKLIIN